MPQYLLGGPGETHKTINETLTFVSMNRHIMVDIVLGYRIMKEMNLYDITVKEGIISKDDDLVFPKFYWESTCSLDWAKQRVNQFKHERKTPYLQWVNLLWKMIKLSFTN